jgi:hypothetical protein
MVDKMETNHQALELSPASLPNDDNITFQDSSFFRNHGAHAELPTPAMVREEAARPKNVTGRWAHKPWAVPFFSMKLLVKYGSSLSIAEGQCLWAIRTTLGQHVPVPEVYGWCRDGNEVFIYMELVEGRTLEDAEDTLTQTDHALIHRQLHHIVISLRSLRQAPGDSFIGKF